MGGNGKSGAGKPVNTNRVIEGYLRSAAQHYADTVWSKNGNEQERTYNTSIANNVFNHPSIQSILSAANKHPDEASKIDYQQYRNEVYRIAQENDITETR